MYQVLPKCPVCEHKLKVTKLKCNQCNTVIENEFKLSKFDYLNREQLHFIEIFIRCRGSIKEVEKELGISYPTVRAKLDEVIINLGYNLKENKIVKTSTNILDALENGEITADEAIKKLQD